MTKQIFYKKLKITLTLILSLICLLSFSVFCFTACGSSTTTDNDSEYSYRYDSDNKIVNGNFNVNTYSVENKSYPVTSPSDWSLTVDNSATTSTISSGIVNVSTSSVKDEDSWRTLLKTLYNDSDFINSYIKDELGLKDQLPSTDSTDAKEESVTKLYDEFFKSPGTHPDSKDDNVLMINNFNSKNLSTGTAQKATSNTAITLEKGTIAKISVWVKTYNLKSIVSDGHGGANVRIISTFNGVEQALYSIYGIDTKNVTDNNGWQKVELYVQADKDYDCTIKVVLGLGFGNSNKDDANDYVQGTAFFDDVTFEEIDELPSDLSAIKHTIDYSYEKSTIRNFFDINTLTSDKYFLYDMSLDSSSFFEPLYLDDSKITSYFTTTPKNLDGTEFYTSKDFFNDSAVTFTTTVDKPNNINEIKFNLTNASYTLEIDNANFSLNPEEFMYITLTIDNNLNRFDKSGITILARDYINNTKIDTTVTTVTDKENETVCKILVKNNFDSGNARTFKLLVVMGPASPSSSDVTDYATGEVIISNLQYAKEDIPEENTDTDYDLYQLFSSTPDSTISLHAGEDDFSAESDATYSLKASGGNLGQITHAPTNVIGYAGITSNHNYIDGQYDNYAINTRIGKDGDNGNYAGLINTKYLDAYNANLGLDIKSKIGNYEDDFQPLMIYNNPASPNAYGFVGESIIVSTSSYKVVTVTLRVVDNAQAFVYLADLTSGNKTVMEMTFKSNTDGISYTTPSEDMGGKLSFEGITADDMNSNGWLTVSFYIATGDNEKNFRVEVWNGSRDYSASTGTASGGYVFIKDISTSDTFTEPASIATAFDGSSDNPLFNAYAEDSSIRDTAVLYKRELDSTEIEYNKTHTGDEAISYDAKYIWAKNSTIVYAIYNTIEPVAVDPNTTETEDEETSSGCSTSSDPSSFWLSFSSILLAAVLLLAIVMLFIKKFRRNSKSKQSEGKSYYKVTSRASTHKANKETKNKQVEKAEEVNETEEEVVEPEQVEENVTETVEEEMAEEVNEQSNEYVYDDVQEFGSDEGKVEETDTTESSEENK